MQRFFVALNREYYVLHNNDDDSRSIIDCEDNTAIFRIDSSCYITDIDGKHVGRIESDGDQWWLILASNDAREDRALGAVNDYDWRDLLNAEIEAIKTFLETEFTLGQLRKFV